MAETNAPQIVMIGLDPLSQGVVVAAAKGQPILQWENDLSKLSELEVVPSLRIILCGPPQQGVSLNEVAQFLRMQYPEAAIFYLTTDRTGFVRKVYVKNGFTDAFLLPLDSATFTTSFQEELSKATSGKVRAYKAVKLVDLQPGQEMDFDTYIHLAANNKHIKYTNAGDPLDSERAEKLKSHKKVNLHIAAEDTKKFYQWTAQQLMNIGKSNSISETEKRDRMQGAVRELISDIFQDSSQDASFEKGKKVVQDCQEIVKAYIMSSVKEQGQAADWYDKLVQLSQTDNTIYTMAASVSTFASLFSMALGVGDPEHLAMAGLLHDIGLSEIPADIQTKPESERTPEEQANYQRHPKISVHLIQTRKMVVPDLVLKIILQHHERYDGKGYPDGLRGDRIKKESQLLAMADEFYLLTTEVNGKPALTPAQALQQMYDSIPASEDGHKYDPDLVKRLYTTLQPK